MKSLLQKTLVSCGVAAIAVTVHADAPSYDATWRYPVITIPLLKTAPQIDGTINEDEWSRATLFPTLVEVDPAPQAGMPSRQSSRVWMGYTSDSLYIAWRQNLPPESLPEVAQITGQRDAIEGVDNTINLMLADEKHEEQFNIAGNSANQLYDRRFDTGESIHWNPDVTYRSHPIATGWEGEMKIPFKELGFANAPAAGTRWHGYFYSVWRRGISRVLAFPYVGWRIKGESGSIVFGDDGTAVRFDAHGTPEIVQDGGVKVEVKYAVFRRKEKAKQAFYQQVASAIQFAQVEGGTFASMDNIVGEALAPFESAQTFDKEGEYLVRYDITRGGEPFARGVQPFYKAPPLDLEIMPRLLNAGILSVEAKADLPNAQSLRATLKPLGGKPIETGEAQFKSAVANLDISVNGLAEGQYQLVAEALTGQKVVASATIPVTRPTPPLWWTNREGLQPLIPEPWVPIKASGKDVEILGRRYTFDGQPIPAQIVTKGQALFAAPAAFVTKSPWKNASWKVVSLLPDAVVYQSENTAGNLTMKATTRVEFDGFIRVDLELTGTGTTDQLDLVLPFKKENAILLANYGKAPGPGSDALGKRFTDMIPVEGYKSPPMITTWVGTDYYGLEFACESSRGWAMNKPNEAMQVTPTGERTDFKVQLISKPIKLSNEPRKITFALIATPTKSLTPKLQNVRFYDDVVPSLLPYDWSGTPVWHAPITDKAQVAKLKEWPDNYHKVGSKLLVNGGWNISTTAPDWETWGKEMTADPLRNVSFSNAKQFASCYCTPYAEFLVNSFGYNARNIGFDGIRFDTVTPGYPCSSLYHKDAYGNTCGWYDDDSNLWPSMSIFEEREIMKRLYRIFHGGVIKDGYIQLPNAGPPLAVVHSFADHHEIGEGFYQYVKTLKEGYSPGLVRALMAGNGYGLRTENNIKDAPLFWNERIGALLLGGAEPRWENYVEWKAGYEAHAKPAPSVCDAWEWVDKWNAEFLGWWNDGAYLQIEKPEQDAMILGSMYLNKKTQRVLMVVTNYEKGRPFTGVGVKLDLKKLGFTGKVYAEDAITFEPIDISTDGAMKLDILGQRYRLVEVSTNPPRYREDNLGENILATTPLPAQTQAEFTSGEFKLEPNKIYVLSAWIKIDSNIGDDTDTPNFMGKFSPTIRLYASFRFTGDVNGINGTHTRSRFLVKGKPGESTTLADSPTYKQKYTPQLWEKTGGWTRVWLPIKTGEKPDNVRAMFGTSDVKVTEVKDWQLREVK